MKIQLKLKISILLVLVVLLFCSSCAKQVNRAEILYEFDDGSKLISQKNYYSAFHLLYDNIGIYSTFRSYTSCIKVVNNTVDFTDESILDENLMNKIDYSVQLTNRWYYVKYAFSGDGYIAFCDYDNMTNTKQYYIYTVADDILTPFNSVSEIYEYSDNNGFNLSKWYYPLSGKLCTEIDVAENNNWSLITTYDGISAVRNKYEDIFAGQIKKYVSENNYLAFNIRIDGTMQDKLRPFENPVLPHDENSEPISYKGVLFKIPIYCDEYIVVNTNDGSYEFFEKKKDAENYLKDKNISPIWQKVVYKQQ